MSSLHYNFDDFTYIKRSDGSKSKRYRHWCTACKMDRGYAYKNKILKELFCHSCKMNQADVLKKISITSKNRTHSAESKQKISSSLYKKYGTNPLNRKIARNLRGRLNQAIRNSYKNGSAVNDLGCSVEELREYLESKFKKGMSWDNYGKDGWHIDHIVPLCRFNLNSKDEIMKACHYSNLQPLWAAENSSKRLIDGTFRKK